MLIQHLSAQSHISPLCDRVSNQKPSPQKLQLFQSSPNGFSDNRQMASKLTQNQIQDEECQSPLKDVSKSADKGINRLENFNQGADFLHSDKQKVKGQKTNFAS